MLNFVWAQRAVKHQGPLQYTLSAHAKFSTLSVHNDERPDMKNAFYVRRKHFGAVSEGFEPPVRSHVHLFSRQAPSTTRTTHRKDCKGTIISGIYKTFTPIPGRSMPALR